MIDLVGGEVLQRVKRVWGMTWSYIQGRHVGVVAEEGKRVPADTSCLELGPASGGSESLVLLLSSLSL